MHELRYQTQWSGQTSSGIKMLLIGNDDDGFNQPTTLVFSFFLQGCLQDILEWSTLEFVIIIAISCGCALVELMSICIGIYVLKHLRRRSFQK